MIRTSAATGSTDATRPAGAPAVGGAASGAMRTPGARSLPLPRRARRAATRRRIPSSSPDAASVAPASVTRAVRVPSQPAFERDHIVHRHRSYVAGGYGRPHADVRGRHERRTPRGLARPRGRRDRGHRPARRGPRLVCGAAPSDDLHGLPAAPRRDRSPHRAGRGRDERVRSPAVRAPSRGPLHLRRADAWSRDDRPCHARHPHRRVVRRVVDVAARRDRARDPRRDDRRRGRPLHRRPARRRRDGRPRRLA